MCERREGKKRETSLEKKKEEERERRKKGNERREKKIIFHYSICDRTVPNLERYCSLMPNYLAFRTPHVIGFLVVCQIFRHT